MDDKRELREFASEHINEELVLVEITKTEGSTYRKKGSLKLISKNGVSSGLISGGCLEGEIIDFALKMKKERDDHIIDTTSPEDRLLGHATGCQGRIFLHFTKLLGKDLIDSKVLDQKKEKAVDVYVIGLGPDIEPLKELLDWTGWNTHYYSYKRDLLEEREKEGWANIAHLDLSQIESDIVTPERSALLLMSHNYPTDLEVLRALHHLPFGYIGLLGPGKKREQMLSDLESIYQVSLSPDVLAKFHGPLGINGLGKGEMNIALSIVSHLQKEFLNE